MKKHLYLLLTVLGTVIPYAYLIPFLQENGLNLLLFFRYFFANSISSMGALDLIISAITLNFWILAYHYKKRVKLFWIPILGTWLIGVSFALPCWLYLLERKKEKTTQ